MLKNGYHAGLLFIFAGIFLLSLLPAVSANAPNGNVIWLPSQPTALALQLQRTICPLSTGSSTITGTVTNDAAQTISDANVFATIRRPDGYSQDVNFTNNLSGTYTYAYDFNVNGMYLIQGHAFKSGLTMGDKNAYVYLGDLNFSIPFLNNNFDVNIGALGTIRNTVYNADGNLVYDVNANTSIIDVNGTIVDANRAMSQASNGEFTYNFFGPSPENTYHVTTVVTCGNNVDSNTAGLFNTHATSSGGGGGGGGGGSGGSGGSSGGGGDNGGGGGGGGGGAGGGKQAQIIDAFFDPAAGRNQSSALKATVENLTKNINDYVVTYTLKAPSGVVFSGEKTVSALAPFLPTTIILNPSVIPAELGDYELNADMLSPNHVVNYYHFHKIVNVGGGHHIQVDLVSTSTKTAQGLTFPFTLTLTNTGDFDESNVQVAWHIMDPRDNAYSNSSLTTSLSKDASTSFPYAPFIPFNAPLGIHTLHVDVTAYGVTQTKELSFEVSSPSDYYSQVIADLELRVDQLDGKIKDLQQRGFDVTDVRSQLLDIQTDLAKAKGTFLAGKFDALNKNLIDLSERLTKLAAMVDLIGQQAPLLSREGLVMIGYAAGILLLLVLAFLLWKKLHDHAATARSPLLNPYPRIPWLHKYMRIDRCYIPLRERKKQKRKALISRLLGLD